MEPFAEATDLTQGEKNISISCVVPIVLSLNRFLMQIEQGNQFSGLVRNLLEGLHDRFQGIFANLKITPPHTMRSSNVARDLSFNDDMFLMASALDPTYAYHWLQDHPATFEERQAIRRCIDGKQIYCYCYHYY